jgi:class 3 adenylate cyclase
MLRIRESFAAKLLAALVGTVGVLFVVTWVVVKAEAARQVATVVRTAVANAEAQLRELEGLQEQQTARLARQLTGSIRTLAALDDAISAGDGGVLADVASQQLELAQLPDSDVLVVFTDPAERPVLTLHGQIPMDDVDPVGVGPAAKAVLEGRVPEAGAYRVVGGHLYHVRTQLIQLAGRPIGTVSLGLPIKDKDATRISALVGVQMCFVVEGACVAGSPEGRGALATALAAAAARRGSSRVKAAGEEWAVRGQELTKGDPAQGYRVIAVPLHGVLAPFQRIIDALALGGAVALLLSILLGLALSRGLTRPVRALVAATGRVARGEYETEVAVRSQDEIGTLARAFNDMTRGLRLKERYRSVLDKVVSPEVAEELMKGDVDLGGENREVSVLFADIRGFTALTAGMEPQAVIGLLNECMERLSAAVEKEAGVVDKYVGDELMAVFGAPAHQADHALRAVRAAVRMRRAIGRLNEVRTARGEPSIGLGIGINTGRAVAGNMGSSDRLNYTVLGETVNLASRLCGGARAGEILVTGSTVGGAGPTVHASSLGGRSFKGFSNEVEVFSVENGTLSTGNAKSGGRGAGAVLTLLLAGAALGLPTSLHAQSTGGLPTLQGLGLGYESPSGRYQVAWSGQLDLEILSLSKQDVGLARGEGTFLAPRLRLFTDIFVGDHLYGLVELRGDRGEAPTRGLLQGRVEQAYVRLSDASGRVSLQVGRFASPFGSYAERHLTPQDPFVRPPLPYDFRTVISRSVAPSSPTAFLTWRDNPAVRRPQGTPPVWGVPYQWGAMSMGTIDRVSYRFAAMNSAPSSDPSAWGFDTERFKHPSWVLGLRVPISPSLAVGGSYDTGPYMDPVTSGTLPAGRSRWDYDQTIWSTNLSYARGPVMAKAEILHDRWQVPNVGNDIVEIGYVGQVQSDLVAGLSAAVRWSYLDFRPWTDTAGAAKWDYDVARYQASVAYRIAKNVGVLASVLTDIYRGYGGPSHNLAALRWWWAF